MHSSEMVRDLIIKKTKQFLSSAGASQGMLAKISGIPKGTISRYAKEDCSAIPVPETALAFLDYFEGSSKALEIMETAYPDWWEVSGKRFAETKRQNLAIKGNFKLSDGIELEIYLRSHRNEGATDEWITKMYGTNGIKIRNKLVEKEVLMTKNGSTFLPTEAHVNITNHGFNKSLMLQQLEQISESDLGVSDYMWYGVDHLSDEATSKVTKAYVDFVNTYRDIRDEDILSNKPKMALACVNTFVSLRR
jgi:hypothetical protein